MKRTGGLKKKMKYKCESYEVDAFRFGYENPPDWFLDMIEKQE